MPKQREQDTPDQFMFILNFCRQCADHVAQVKTSQWRTPLHPSIAPRSLKVTLPQLGILLQVEEKHIDRRANELVDSLARRCLERDIHLVWADISALIYERGNISP